MCGLTGYWILDVELRINNNVIDNMTNCLSHRGPNDFGKYVFSSKDKFKKLYKHDYELDGNSNFDLAFGHRRLSILDLSEGGWQPQKSEDGRYVLVFNGEIFNYIELKKELEHKGIEFKSTCDTEVLLKSFEAWGLKCFEKFNGMWAIAIFDHKDNKLILSRDRMGKKPLYYFFDNKKIVFSSEIKSLFCFPGIEPVPNINKIINYSARHYRYVDNDNDSYYERIFQVPKSSVLILNQSGAIHIDNYWEINHCSVELVNDFNEAKEKFLFLLEDAVKIRMRSDVPIGCFLSGGMDSTSITAMAAKFHSNFQTISAVTGKDYYDESEYINAVIDHVNVKSEFVYPKPQELFNTLREMLKYHDEPICTITWYSMYLMVKESSRLNIPVILTGHGGDELLAGYWDHFHYKFL